MLRINQYYYYKSVILHFKEVQRICLNKIHKIRNRIISLPLKKLDTGKKCHSFNSIKTFSNLHIDLKYFNVHIKSYRAKIKS